MRLLSSYGHDVVVISSERSGADWRGWHVTRWSGIDVHLIPVPYGNAMGFRRRLRAFFQFAIAAATHAAGVGGEVVFATSTPLTIAVPAMWAKWRLSIPMVFEVRDLWPEVPIAVGALRNPVLKLAARWLEGAAYRSSARIVALSPGMKEGIVRRGVPPERVHVIPNCADIELFRVPPERGWEWRRQHPEIADRPMVLYAGTLGRINGVDWLVRVAHAATELAPEVCFVIVGDGREKQRVEEEARHLGVLGRNLFIHPPVAKQEMPAVLSAATVCTSLVIDLEALWDNSANKFFDALAAGRPVVLNHEGWQAELLRAHGAGVVLPVRDVEEAARRLVDRVRDAKWVQGAGAAAARLAEGRFDRAKLAKELNSVLLSAGRDHRV